MSRPQSFLWVTKWVDYSNKYGFGYQLSNQSVGVLFNEGTHLSLSNQRKYVFKELHYLPRLSCYCLSRAGYFVDFQPEGIGKV